MAYAEFYNLNANISYPFVPTTTDTFAFISGGAMPKDLILDCGFTLGPLLNYDPEVGVVYLRSIKRVGDNLQFTFYANTGTEILTFVFVRDKDSDFGDTDYQEGAGGPSYGIGFLVTGDLSVFHGTLLEGEEKVLFSFSEPGHLYQYDATVEPALVITTLEHAVLDVSVGNLLRLEDQPCDGCGTPTPLDNTTVRLQDGAEHMVGRIRIRPGYNIAVSANTDDQAISLVASVGEGMGEVCDADPVRYAGDIPDQGSRCRDFIFTIDGIGPNDNGAFQIEGAGNFFVRPIEIGFLQINSRIGQTTVCPDE